MGGWSGGMSMGRDRFHGNTYNTMVGDEEDYMQKRARPLVGVLNTLKSDAARGGAIEDRLLMGKGKGLAKKHNFEKDPKTGTWAGDKPSHPTPPPQTPSTTAAGQAGVSSIETPEAVAADPRVKNPFRK